MALFTRRRILTYGVGGASLLAVGGGLRWAAFGYALRPGEAAIGLTTKEFCVVRAVVEAFFPAEDGFPSGVELAVHQRIDEEVWAQPDEVQKDLRAALHLIEHSPPLFGAFSRFTRLDVEGRGAVFRRLLTSDVDAVVQAAVALKQMAHLFYYGRQETWAAVSYDGPWVPQPRPAESSLRYGELLRRAKGARA